MKGWPCKELTHAFDLKQSLIAHLKALGHTVTDQGTLKKERCDYPDYAAAAGRAAGAKIVITHRWMKSTKKHRKNPRSPEA